MKKRYFILLIILIIGLDQLTKYLVATNLDLYERIPIIKGFFSLFYIRNDGAAFSMLSGNTILFYIISLIALYICYHLYKNAKTKLTFISVAFLGGGILGNFIDRIRFQEVIDFISFTFGSYDFAIFNLADTYIFIAVVLLIVDYFVNEKRVK